MLRTTLALVGALMLSACANRVTDFKGPDGQPIKTAKCNVDRNKCYASATESCSPTGEYRVLSSESHMGGLFADILVGPVVWYSMTYQCGAPDGVMPDFRFGGQQFVPPPVSMPAPVRGPTTVNCSTIGANTTCRSY